MGFNLPTSVGTNAACRPRTQVPTQQPSVGAEVVGRHINENGRAAARPARYMPHLG